MHNLVLEWASAAPTVVWPVVAENNAETIRPEPAADRHDSA